MRQMDNDRLLALVQSYFQEHLQRVRGASPHTIHAYGHAVRLFFLFLAERLRRPVAKLGLDDIQVNHVLAFLDHLETTRHNAVSSRNCRLIALRGLVEHLLRHDLSRAEAYHRILAVSDKKTRSRPVTYLDPELARAVLARPDSSTTSGAMHYALLLFLYNTGARVGEALAVKRGDLQLSRPYQVHLLGKGRKERFCPLWPETVRALRQICPHHEGPQALIFRNSHGAPLTRDGVAYIVAKYAAEAAQQYPALRRCRVTPHVLRHSCAVALLQAGVDVTVIRDYLGHASISTTSRYISTNLQMRRDVLERFWNKAGLRSRCDDRWRPTPKLLDFLSSL